MSKNCNFTTFFLYIFAHSLTTETFRVYIVEHHGQQVRLQCVAEISRVMSVGMHVDGGHGI